MTRLSLLILLLVSAFYIAWPAYTAHRISAALDAGDAATLEQKIDFASVRASMRPVVAAKIDESLKATLKTQGAGGALVLDQVRKEAMPKLVDGALDMLVTPQSLIRMHAEGRSLKEAMEGVSQQQPQMKQRIGDLIGGILGREIPGLGKPSAGGPSGSPGPATTPARDKHPLGIGNVKSLAFDGPLTLAIGLARDPKAREADVTAQLSFTGTDWKLTGLVPRL